ncbi:ABC transporter [Colletotrichum falcatum]|nr:ABC transporter [Colletotrichum falcatum]
MSSGCLNDHSLGPAVKGCRGDFDFTLRFESIFLSIIPAAVFAVLSLPRTAYLSRKPRIVSGKTVETIKLAIVTVFATLQFALLIIQTTSNGSRIDGFAAAASGLSLLASLCMIVLSYAEHSRSARPSMLLTGYIFLQILFDVAQVRTSWLMAETFSSQLFARLFTASLAVKVVILFVEAQRKARWISWTAEEHSPEETSGLFSLGVYFWLNRLFLHGYRNVLSIKDLYALDQGMIAETMQVKLARELDKGTYRGKKHGLARALAKSLAVPLLLPVAPRIALIGFNYSQPFFIQTLLVYLQDPDESKNKNMGYGMIGAAFLIYTGIAVSTALYYYFHQRALYMSRGCLSAAIYRKTTQASLVGTGDAAAVTLMSTDIERILRGFYALHEVWANFIEIALGCWLLQGQLGAAFIAPIAVILVCTGITAAAAAATSERQARWMSHIQKRVGLTSHVISSMKNLRISGITGPVGEFVSQMRKREMEIGNDFRWLLIVTAISALSPAMISPAVTFAFAQSRLDVTTIFTSFSFLVLLNAPLGTLFQSIPGLIAGFTCLGRIQKFLEADPRVDFRQFSQSSTRKDKRSEESYRDSVEGISLKSMDKPANRIPERCPPSPAIAIVDGSFGWETEKPVLRNITASVPASQLTLVVGPVASGKSTLCKALLGEVPFSSGLVSLSSRNPVIGYCEQNPFLSNGSIKDNVLGYSPFSQSRYDEVLDACMLSKDLLLLPYGDDTKIGSNGIMLSGGQKQRVSLARALYAHTDLLILDDILSGLDNDTAAEVVRKVFGLDGIIRRRRATAVLCTHAIKYLPLADHIICLGPEGTLIEEGTFDDLMRNKKYVASLGVKATGSDTDSDAGSISDSKPGSLPAPKPRRAPALVDEIMEKSRQTGDVKVYLHYLRSLSVPATVIFVLCSASYAIWNTFPTIWMKYWAEDSLGKSSQYYAGLFGFFKALQLISLVVGGIALIIYMTTSSGIQLHEQALRTVVHAPLTFLTNTDTGIITNLFSQDMTLLDNELPNSMLNAVISGFEAIAMAAVIAYGSPLMAVSYPFVMAFCWIIQKFYLRTSRQLRLLDLESKSPLYSNFLDAIKGVATIRAFGWQDKEIATNQNLLDTSQRPAYLLAMIQQWLVVTMQLMVACIAVILVGLAVGLRATSAGFTGASMVTLMSWGETISWFIRCWVQLETSLGAVARIKTFSEKVTPEDLPGEDIELPEDWPENGWIDVKGVSASYSTEQQTSSEGVVTPPSLALSDVTFSIKPGERVALCGRTGSGKSSLILLLLRLLDPVSTCSQNIEIDGVPFHRIDRSTLRRRIIAVPQDAVFLPDGSTIKSNLDPFEAASDAECLSVLRAVQLAGFVEERGGLHEGMSADSLSAGQKQLFSLGRAILRRRTKDARSKRRGGGILLLDEVSSSVDHATDRLMQEIIKEEFGRYTIVMVSHRLDMVMDYFQTVIVMDQGRVIETGSPAELVDTKGSRFGELWAIENQGRSREA